jgi:hypothetical protein
LCAESGKLPAKLRQENYEWNQRLGGSSVKRVLDTDLGQTEASRGSESVTELGSFNRHPNDMRSGASAGQKRKSSA